MAAGFYFEVDNDTKSMQEAAKSDKKAGLQKDNSECFKIDRKVNTGGKFLMKKLIETLKSYNLPFQSITDIAESVSAWTKYEQLPQATKDSLQIIADINNVIFSFNDIRGKLVLTGISTNIRSNYLYTAKTLKYNRKLQSKKDLLLLPGANNKLITADI